MKRRDVIHRERPPRAFDELNTHHPLRPLKGAADLIRAQAVADRLAVLGSRTKDQDDYLETLATLIEKYEAEHAAIDTENLDPVETLRYLMKGRGMSASDLGRVLGERSLGAAVLRRDRQLSKAHICALCAHFSVGPALFLKPSDAGKATPAQRRAKKQPTKAA